MRLTSGQGRGCHPGEHSGLQFYNQRKWEGGKITFILILEQASSVPPPDQGGKFSCPYRVKPGPSWHHGYIVLGLNTIRVFYFEMLPFHKIIVFYTCREHVLGIINLQSSLGRMWGSCCHCVVWGHVLCLCCMVC